MIARARARFWRQGATAIALVIVLLSAGLAARAYANHEDDGHMYDWKLGTPGVQSGLHRGLIRAVADRPTVCSDDFPTSTWNAAVVWWNGLGGSPYNYIEDCSDPDFIVTTDGFSSVCPASSHACTNIFSLGSDPDFSINCPCQFHVNPSLFSLDGDAHLTRDIVHEMGHGLGHDHYAPTACVPATVMAHCTYNTLQALDISNYHGAYHIDEVTSLGGTSSSPGAVALSWEASHIHNENDISIWRDNGSGGLDFVAWVGRNTESRQLFGQPSGWQVYWVFAAGWADYTHVLYGDPASASVFVQ